MPLIFVMSAILLLLPDKWLSRLVGKIKVLVDFGKSMFKDSRLEAGHDLMESITFASQEGGGSSYKFYSRLFEKIKSHMINHGGHGRKSLRVLKKLLSRDLRYESRVREKTSGARIQVVITIVLTWSMILLSARQVEGIALSPVLLVTLAVIQMGMFILYSRTVNLVRERVFRGFDELTETVCIFRTLVGGQLSVVEVVKQFPPLCEEGVQYLAISRKIGLLIRQYQSRGILRDEDLAAVIDDLDFLQEQLFARLDGRLDVLKTLGVILVFLTGYGLFFYSIALQFP